MNENANKICKFTRSLTCEQDPKWGIGRKEKSASWASGKRYIPLGSLFTGYKIADEFCKRYNC